MTISSDVVYVISLHPLVAEEEFVASGVEDSSERHLVCIEDLRSELDGRCGGRRLAKPGTRDDWECSQPTMFSRVLGSFVVTPFDCLAYPTDDAQDTLQSRLKLIQRVLGQVESLRRKTSPTDRFH